MAGESRQGAAIAVILIFPIFTTLSVGLRVLSRYLGRTFGWDDGLIVLCWALVLGETVAVYQYTKYSFSGYHVWDIPPQTIEQQIRKEKYNMANQMFYHPIMSLVRASVIVFLFRVEDTRRFIQIALYTTFVFNMAYLLATFNTNLFQCTPIQYAWEYPKMDRIVDGQVVKGGKCINTLKFFLISQGFSILLDLMLMPIPTIMVWNLQMARRTKILMAVIMSMGWIVTAVSVVRWVVYYYRFSPSNKDRSYNIGYIVSIIEVNLAIIAASAPSLKALTRRLSPRFLPDSGSPYTSSFSRNESARPSNVGHQTASDAMYNVNNTKDGLRNSSEERIIESSHGESVRTGRTDINMDTLTARDVSVRVSSNYGECPAVERGGKD